MDDLKNIQIDCNLTERMYRRYMRFHVLGDKKTVLAHIALSGLIALFGFMNFHAGSPILGWVFVTLGVYFLVSRYLRFYISVNRITEQYALTDQPKFFYALTFADDGFDVENDREQAHYPMDRIYRACFLDRDRIAYLYLTRDSAFLLPYDGFKTGSPSELKELLKGKMDNG